MLLQVHGAQLPEPPLAPARVQVGDNLIEEAANGLDRFKFFVPARHPGQVDDEAGSTVVG
jgi:hypothetical protein